MKKERGAQKLTRKQGAAGRSHARAERGVGSPNERNPGRRGDKKRRHAKETPSDVP